MGCCPNKPCDAWASTIPNILPKEHGVHAPPFSSIPSIHPCRLTEFDDTSFESRCTSQLITVMNRNMNSPFVFSEQESCRRPDPRTILLLIPKIMNEVEQVFVTYLTTGWLGRTISIGARCSFKAVAFKRSEMKESQLSAAIIEAALTHIIDHLDEHPKAMAALGTNKIGYHDKGMALEDIGARVFVVEVFAPDNTA